MPLTSGLAASRPENFIAKYVIEQCLFLDLWANNSREMSFRASNNAAERQLSSYPAHVLTLSLSSSVLHCAPLFACLVFLESHKKRGTPDRRNTLKLNLDYFS